MTKKTRNILFSVFVLAFAIIAPLVCLYAAGYQVGSNFSVQKTGILVIKTKPTAATIYLENKTQKNLVDNLLQTDKKSYTTPNRIKNLLPGKYDIKLEKEGYFTWEKQLQIDPGQSIYIENVNLFKNNLPTLLNNQQYSDLIPSPNGKMLLVIYQYGADVINIGDDTVKNIKIATASAKTVFTRNNCSWSPDNDAIILDQYLYELSSIGQTSDINELTGDSSANIRWNLTDKNHINYISHNSLYDFNLNNKEKKLIAKDTPTKDYLARGSDLFFLRQENDSVMLNVWSLSENKLIRKINLPNSDYTFINQDNNLINLLDKNHKTLYLIDPFAELKPIIEIINNVSNARWINNDKLIYANDYELWIYDVKNYYKILLTRISEQITNVFPFTNENYLFYATERNINIMEMDSRDKYNIIKLVELEKIKDPYLNKDGDALYFYSKIGNNAGIYKLVIQ